MYKKLCPQCCQPSFSSCESGSWICPVCGNDLTFARFQDAESQESRPIVREIQESLTERMEKQLPTKLTFDQYI